MLHFHCLSTHCVWCFCCVNAIINNREVIPSNIPALNDNTNDTTDTRDTTARHLVVVNGVCSHDDNVVQHGMDALLNIESDQT